MSYARSQRPVTETWGRVSMALLGFACLLQAVGFGTPGWFREDADCGNEGLVYYQSNGGNAPGDETSCEYLSKVEKWSDTIDRAYKIEREYDLADDVIGAILPLVLCGLVLLLLLITPNKVLFLGLSIQILAVANVVQWSLVYKHILNNIREHTSEYNDDTVLFPYSLFLFGLGTLVTGCVAIFHIIQYIGSSKSQSIVL